MIGTSIKLVSKLKTLIYPIHQSFSEMKKFENNFLSTTNLDYIESLYVKWTQDKTSVSPSFQAYF